MHDCRSRQSRTPSATAIETVFETLLADIVARHLPRGLAPARRARAVRASCGASRPTLREALRRLGEWNLVEPRRGSGVVVRAVRASGRSRSMPAYLRYAEPEARHSRRSPRGPGRPARRSAARSCVEVDCGWSRRACRPAAPPARAPPMARAWRARHRRRSPREDFEIMRRWSRPRGSLPAAVDAQPARRGSTSTPRADAVGRASHRRTTTSHVRSKFFDAVDGPATDRCREQDHADYLARHDGSARAGPGDDSRERPPHRRAARPACLRSLGPA